MEDGLEACPTVPKSWTVTMFGWFNRASAWASRVNRSANCASCSFSRARIFKRDEAVQARLACLVHDAHAAATEAFEDFQLRKQRGDFRGRRRRMHDLGSMRAGATRSLRLGGETGLQHAFGANTAQRRGGTGFPQCGQLPGTALVVSAGDEAMDGRRLWRLTPSSRR